MPQFCGNSAGENLMKNGSKNKSGGNKTATPKKYNPTDERILRLESQLVAERAEKNALASQTKILKKKAAIFEALVEQMHEYVPPLEPLPGLFKPPKEKKITEHLVMHLSDIHGDEVVKASQVGGLEDYDFEIACLRAQRYVEQTIEHTQVHLTNYSFPTLWLLSYGDLTSGEIHGGTARSYFRNQFKNCLAIGRMKAMMIRDLAPYFQDVKVICLPGNHGRRSKKKDYDGAHDNWDYLVCETAAMLTEDIPNVEFTIPDQFSINVDINGSIFNISHGDDIKSWNSIPYYGIERKTRRLAALHSRQPINYFCMGHFHQPAMLDNGLEGETIINGPWLATGTYAYEGLAAASKPRQWIHGVHAKNGISWRMPIDLRLPGERKLLSDRRYKIEV